MPLGRAMRTGRRAASVVGLSRRPAGGAITLPTWRQSIAAGTWGTVSAATMSDVDPEADADLNPNHPSASPWRGSNGQMAVIDAWGSACWDEAGKTLWIPLGGGHGNYSGNEPYKVDLSVNAPAFSMLRPPSGATGYSADLSDSVNDTYTDGRLRSAHTYGNVVYVPGVGPVITRSAATAPAAGSSSKIWLVNESTGESTAAATLTWAGTSYPYIGSTFDTSRSLIYHVGNGAQQQIAYIDPSDWSTGFIAGAGVYLGSYGQLVYLPDHDRILCVTVDGDGFAVAGAPYFKLVHPTTGAVSSLLTVSGSFPSGFDFQGGRCGICWCSALSQLLLWNNATNTTVISTMTLNGGMDTLTIGALTVDGANAVTPSAAASQGTYGRFGYSPSLKGCYLLNANDESVYFFATE